MTQPYRCGLTDPLDANSQPGRWKRKRQYPAPPIQRRGLLTDRTFMAAAHDELEAAKQRRAVKLSVFDQAKIELEQAKAAGLVRHHNPVKESP